MRNIWIIAKREYNHYFISPIAYVVAFLILFAIGLLFAINVYFFIQNAFQSFGQTPEVTIITWVFGFLLVFAIPAITMRLLADEARMGTLELLLTAPVRDFELVAGKWLGSLLFMLTILAITLVYPLILNSLVTPGIDQKLAISSYLGLALVMASFLALGVGISAVFTNQIAAFFVTLVTFLFLWFLVGIPAQVLQGTASGVFQYLDMSSHYDALNVGNIKLSDLVYFFSLIALGLFIGTTAIETRRWN
jgi:ABC-2 type transport system permease protein